MRQVAHLNWFGGYYQEPKNFLIVFAVEPQSLHGRLCAAISISRRTRARRFLRERTGALVGEAMARKWGWKVGDRVPIVSNIFSQQNGSRTWDLTIVGIIKAKKPQIDTNFMVFQYGYFDETRSFGKDQIGWMVLQTTSPSENDKVAKAIDALFANSSYETATDTEKAFNKAFVAQIGNIALIVTLVVGAAFVTILMIVGNTMALTDPRAHARDRRAQDARLLRAAHPRHGARRVGAAGAARRHSRARARRADRVHDAREPVELHTGVRDDARHRADRARADRWRSA